MNPLLPLSGLIAFSLWLRVAAAEPPTTPAMAATAVNALGLDLLSRVAPANVNEIGKPRAGRSTTGSTGRRAAASGT